MPSAFTVSDSRLAGFGIRYAGCTCYDAADFACCLFSIAVDAWEHGATALCCASYDDAWLPEPDGFSAGSLCFTPDGSFCRLEKNLAAPQSVPTLRLKPLRPFISDLFAALYNEAFSTVAHARSMDAAYLAAQMNRPDSAAGLFMEGGMPVGVYVIDTAGDPAEISAVAVRTDLWGQGYGRRALFALEHHLFQQGVSQVQLVVSEKNTRALHLYHAAGYRECGIHSRWFRAELSEDRFRV